jgi:hypothetical protein
MRRILSILVLIIFLLPSFAGAVTVTLDDGTSIDLEGLSDTERTNMIKYIDKLNKAKKSTLTDSATEAFLETAKDPVKLDQWRRLITGTLKDIANDLNVSVNEFVKTPVGLGAAALLFYKVAGKDIMATAFGVIFAIPFWFMIIITCAFTAKYFLGHKTEMITITSKARNITDVELRNEVMEAVDGNEAVEIKRPIRVCRYDWTSNDARNAFGCFMIGIPIITTIVCFLVVFI